VIAALVFDGLLLIPWSAGWQCDQVV